MNLKFSSYSDCDATEFMMWVVQRNEASKELTRGQAKNDTTVGFGAGDQNLCGIAGRICCKSRARGGHGESAKLRKSWCARFSAWAIPRGFLVMLFDVLRAERSCCGAFIRVLGSKDDATQLV